MRLLIAGGGTGGHLFPAIAVAEELMGRGRKNSVLFVGTKRGIEGKVLPSEGWQVVYVAAEALKGRGLLGKVKSMLKMSVGIVQSMKHIGRFSPDAVLGMGGYSSASAVIAGKFSGVKTALHEQNAMPGLTNRVLSRFADRVFVTFPESKRFFNAHKVMITGNPLRRKIIDALSTERVGKKKERDFVLFIFGGSRGARRINEAAMGAFCGEEADSFKGIKIIHQTGEEDNARVKAAYSEKGIDADVPAFIGDMAAAYVRADLVVCRAGATTITELTAAGKAAILVPYPFAADDHQRLNAEPLAKAGAAKIVADSELSPERLAEEIKHYSQNREELADMGRNAFKMAKRDGAEAVVDALSDLTQLKTEGEV